MFAKPADSKSGVVPAAVIDPRVEGWFMTDTFWPVIVSLTYLAIVLAAVARDRAAKKATGAGAPPLLGPDVMKPIAAVHNTVLFFLSLWMTIECFTQASINFGWCSGKASPIHFWIGNQVEAPKPGKPTEFATESGRRLAFVMYVHFLSKVYEMGDTLIMILKGNMRQVSFLHVYHHALTFYPSWWIVFRYSPGGDAFLSCALNSLVHVFMYGYYFETSLKFSIFFSHFKKYLTQFQIVQFCIYVYQASTIILSDSFQPRISHWIQLSHSLLLLVMFTSFYVSSYTSKSKSAKTK